MDDSQQQQEFKLANLEKRVASVEKLLRILDSELNNKIRWIIKTVGISNGEGTVEEWEDEPRRPPPRPRILQRQIRRKTTMTPMSYHQPSRIIVPEVQYEHDDEEDGIVGYVQDEDQDETNGSAMDVEYEDDAGDFYEEPDSEDPLAVELVEGETEDQADGKANADADDAEDQGQNEANEQSPWRFDGQDQDQDEEDADPQVNLPIQAHFMDVSQLRSSDTSMTRRPLSGNALRAGIIRKPAKALPYTSNFRLIQARNRPNILSRRAIVPKNRYLSSGVASNSSHQKLLATAGTNLTEVKYSPKKPTILRRATSSGTSTSGTPNPAATATTSDTKEKVYYCDRCPLTFTLSTRHAHYELHKQLDLNKKQDKNKSGSSSPVKAAKRKASTSPNPKSLLKPISSLLPARKPRIRPRKVCPICTKSYSRNQYLRNHLQEHEAEFPFVCKECFIVLQSEKELEDHCQASDKCFISTYQP